MKIKKVKKPVTNLHDKAEYVFDKILKKNHQVIKFDIY